MKRYSRGMAWLLIVVVVLQWGPVLDACTILGVGKRAMADGSAVITHNDDSSVADYPLRIVPAQDWPEGAKRKIVANAHTREGGNVLGTMPQVKHTYRLLHVALLVHEREGRRDRRVHLRHRHHDRATARRSAT